jgi:hypothetical protein
MQKFAGSYPSHPKRLGQRADARLLFFWKVLISAQGSTMLTKRLRPTRGTIDWGKSWNGQHLLLKKFA